jgi:ribonuclease HI
MGTSQKAELTALTQVLTIAKDKTANICTDSKYAFLIAHSHAAIWKERGFLTTWGSPVVNGPLIAKLFRDLQLPREVTIIHCRGHQTSNDRVAQENSFAELMARKTAEQSTLPPILFLSPSFTPNYEPEKQVTLLKEGGITSANGWIFKDNLLILLLGQATEVITAIHNSLHIGPNALFSFLGPLFHPRHLKSTIHQVQEACSVCSQANPQGGFHLRQSLHQLRDSQPNED